MNEEIDIKQLQQALFDNWQGGVLSNWIDILRKAFPEAKIINYLGSTTGRINGVFYEFHEKYYMESIPLIIKINGK